MKFKTLAAALAATVMALSTVTASAETFNTPEETLEVSVSLASPSSIVSYNRYTSRRLHRRAAQQLVPLCV